jgi:uncharacterized membrane protein YphA (DoxX/SURF4 family)
MRNAAVFLIIRLFHGGRTNRGLELQRLFSTFPAGRPGFGLLVLRVAVFVILVLQGRTLWGHSPASVGGDPITPVVVVAGMLNICAAALLLAGFVTPFAGLAVAIGELGLALLSISPSSAGASSSGQWLPPVFAATIACALVLLGPGAFSVDARLFGRREVIIPTGPDRFDSNLQ